MKFNRSRIISFAVTTFITMSSLLVSGQCYARGPGELTPSPSDTPPNTLQTVIDDMTLPFEGVPLAPPGDTAPYIRAGNTPPDNWNYITPWGQAFEEEGGSPSTNTLVAVREPVIYLYSKSKQTWVRMINMPQYESAKARGLATVNGALYLATYENDTHFNLDASAIQPDRSLAAKPDNGLVFHYWTTSGRAKMYSPEGVVNKSDIGGLFASFQARLIVENENLPDDRDIARFLVNTGADYWKEATGRAGLTGHATPAIGGGRLKFVTKEWQHFNFCTLSEAELLAIEPIPDVVGYPQHIE